MSGDWPGQLLANPILRTVALTTEAALNVVTLSFNFERSFEGQDDTIRFFIQPETLMLRRISKRETMFNGSKTSELTTDETYSQSSFDTKLNLDLFRAAAPLDYKLVNNFYGPTSKP